MTIPYLMNCAHDDEGWCLACVKKLGEELSETCTENLELKDQIFKLKYEIDKVTSVLNNQISNLKVNQKFVEITESKII